ncbi:alanine dehydrogenase [Flavobacteriaceae bacterium]|uniref:alanine dehydrogenase n=1 Tax=Candidatus Arcticimaribacter forsetii TaxID=2820661 RepID=UPI00207752EC|nr:alanine dehydrogenase [Candidatus Arcticimaribacter forsetii]MDA8698768.1 alanine dehydrogenase [Flavobacteriaceae bacterium]MDB2325735.1 alanine dehydrogenase [Flavobacteriaceae bacterium]MDB4674705.1 alanine dehydrogenase [Flavobacteriaceae bacterium]MDB4751348.1 alanine dehydrogenase [Flavobacteriaceae bacterium]MDC0959825.1 alanine dehydrogenase [Flavobacteriaceae bacterium]
MLIGVPKEIKNNEFRVGLTPASVAELFKSSNTIFIEKNAGVGSGFTNEEYIKSGAKIINSAEEVYQKSEMIVKVKEPLPEEFNLIQEDQILFTYFHFASSKELTLAMLQQNCICISYETVENHSKKLPLLIPMSEVAGRMSIQQGAKYLEKPQLGKGILLGGVPGVPPAKVLILGGGIVGTEAAKMAAGLGAEVYILDINMERLRYLSEILPPNVTTLYSSEDTIRRLIKNTDLIIGAVLVPGAKAPKLITKDMLKEMTKGTVLVDVAVDQGGCFETCVPTTHKNPTFIIDDIVHYCVANIPGAVPKTSTQALNNVTLPYVKLIALKGWKEASKQNKGLSKGLNIINGSIVYKSISSTFNLPYIELETILN